MTGNKPARYQQIVNTAERRPCGRNNKNIRICAKKVKRAFWGNKRNDSPENTPAVTCQPVFFCRQQQVDNNAKSKNVQWWETYGQAGKTNNRKIIAGTDDHHRRSRHPSQNMVPPMPTALRNTKTCATT